jgi:hypothetical protein
MMNNNQVQWMNGCTIGGVWAWMVAGVVVVLFVVVVFNQFFKKQS